MKISVIIPTFNEEKTINGTLENLFSKHSPDEIIVVDGGSSDKTVWIAREWTQQVLRTAKGRARQMNEGAQSASGDIFLFLHAGTKLPKGGLLKIKHAISEGAKAGRFRISFDSGSWIFKLCSAYTQFPLFPFGSQGFFVCREIFKALRGFREDVPFEDIDFYMRLHFVTRPFLIQEAVVAPARDIHSAPGRFWKKFLKRLFVNLYYAAHSNFLLKRN